MQELPGEFAAVDVLYKCRFSRSRFAIDPEKTRSFLEPLAKQRHFEDPFEGLLERVLDLFHPIIKLF